MAAEASKQPVLASLRRHAMRFVLVMGVVSLFSDMTHEGARSALGPYLAALGASAFSVGVVTGLGEFTGYSLRLISGRLTDASGRFWPITIAGYVVQMAAVPALALTHTWPEAAVLIVLERAGRAVRNPPRDLMLSYAARQMGGYGWTFGLHEAFDQFGAMLGPLIVGAILAMHGSFRHAFAVLAIPAALNITLVLVARLGFPNPQALDESIAREDTRTFNPTFWIYVGAAALVATGFADYPLIAYHLVKANIASSQWISAFYAVAMASSGASSLLFGRLFDTYGFRVLIGLTCVSCLFAPLVFFGGFYVALIGAAIWGMGMGVHESIIPAAVTPMVPVHRRASAFGLFTSIYGAAWFLGSAAIGFLYDRSTTATTAFCVAFQLAAAALLVVVWRRQRVTRVA